MFAATLTVFMATESENHSEEVTNLPEETYNTFIVTVAITVEPKTTMVTDFILIVVDMSIIFSCDCMETSNLFTTF
jgi:BarA-like signal transduction histidine kinase